LPIALEAVKRSDAIFDVERDINWTLLKTWSPATISGSLLVDGWEANRCEVSRAFSTLMNGCNG
jgi:hypothetical protein